jgi:hypothetical protein
MWLEIFAVLIFSCRVFWEEEVDYVVRSVNIVVWFVISKLQELKQTETGEKSSNVYVARRTLPVVVVQPCGSGEVFCIRVQLKRDGTQWRTGGEVKGKVANGVGSQYPSLPQNLVYSALLPLVPTPRLPVVDWTDAPADLNGLIRFAERQNLVSAHVPSHFRCSLLL